jgi:predicted ATPase
MRASPGRPRRTPKKSARRSGRRYWSAEVSRRSDALDLERRVFKREPRAIAASLKRSAERSRRRKGTPFQSAMSMLNFYANRAGRGLSGADKRKLEQAKEELRNLFGRDPLRARRSFPSTASARARNPRRRAGRRRSASRR